MTEAAAGTGDIEQARPVRRVDHVMFGAFLASFMVPELPFMLPGLGRVTVPATTLVVFLWMASSVKLLSRNDRPWSDLPTRYAVVFAAFALVPSFLSFAPVSVVYALHFSFVVISAAFLLPRYLRASMRGGHWSTTVLIMVVTIGAYGFGTLLSFWVGPFNPMVTLGHERFWSGLHVMMAVGFGENHNVVGALLLCMIPVIWYVWCPTRRWLAPTLVTMLVLALFATVSRGAILAFVLAVLLVLALHWRVVWTRVLAVDVPTRGVFALAASVSALAVLGIVLIANEAERFQVLLGGLTDLEVMRNDLYARYIRWDRGWDAFLAGGLLEMILGQGFYGSSGHGGRAWSTPHNLYIAVLGDFGIVGMFLLALFLGAVLGGSLSAALHPGSRRAGTAAFVVIVALLIHNLTGEFLYSAPIVALLFIPTTLFDLARQKGIGEDHSLAEADTVRSPSPMMEPGERDGPTSSTEAGRATKT